MTVRDGSATGDPQPPAHMAASRAELTGSGLAMADHQLELHRVLSERSQTPADWYRGALMALADTSNPERYVHAAQSLRELMKKLHIFMNVPREGDAADLGNKVRHMAERWEQAREATGCHDNGLWAGQIDNHLNRGLLVVDQTVAWFRTNRPAFRETSIALFRHVDVSPRQLPPSIEDAQVKRWSELHDYFNRVAHHGEADQGAFLANLDAAERFMLDRLRPETSKEYSRLDKLIAEAEHAT